MISIRGTFHNGSAKPDETVKGREGQPVLITFLDEDTEAVAPSEDAEWNALTQLLEACKVDTGISDLAHQHDH